MYAQSILFRFIGGAQVSPPPPFCPYSDLYLSCTIRMCAHAQAKMYIESMPTFPKKDFTKFFVGANPKAVEVLDHLLVMDPDRRASAAELLAHPYFANYADPDDEVGGV